MSPLGLDDLVRNRTLSPEMAATLVVAMHERRGLLVAAIPRMAGKSTTMMAALAEAAAPIHVLSQALPSLGIPAGDGGYLVLSEIARAPFAEYLWGPPVRTAFEAAHEGGFGIAAALHAGSIDEAFDIITRGNQVPDEHAGRLELMVYIRSLGHWMAPDRRVVAAMYEVVGVADGRPDTRLLYHWDEASDRFLADAGQSVGAPGSGGDFVIARERFEAALAAH